MAVLCLAYELYYVLIVWVTGHLTHSEWTDLFFRANNEKRMCKGCFKLKFVCLSFCLFKNCYILLWQVSFDLIYYWIFSSGRSTSLKEGLPSLETQSQDYFVTTMLLGSMEAACLWSQMVLCTGKIHAHRYILLLNFAGLWLSVFIADYSCIELFCFIFMSSNSCFFHIFHIWYIS